MTCGTSVALLPNRSTSDTIFTHFRYVKQCAKKPKRESYRPCGTYKGDRLIYYDPKSARISSEDTGNSHILMIDGTGYQVGGSCLCQHAVRLSIHRKLCEDKECKVFGCKVGKVPPVSSPEKRLAYEELARRKRKR